MGKPFWAALAAAGTLCFSGPAFATVEVIDFYQNGPIFAGPSGVLPFDIAASDTPSGSITIDDATRVGNSAGKAAVTALTWTTGSKTWTLADIQSATVDFNAKGLIGVALFFASDFSSRLLISPLGGEYFLFDPAQNAAIGQVFHAPLSGAPEPASWTMLIGGFMGIGALLRRQRGLSAGIAAAA